MTQLSLILPLDSYPLSPAQEGMLFHSLYAPGEALYFEQRWCLLQGELNLEAFRTAWQQVLARHDVLRTAFSWQNCEKPQQLVYEHVVLPIDVQDWQHISKHERESKLQAFLLEDRQRGFDFSVAPLMRCTLLRLSNTCYHFVWSYHHLLMDGWCNGILISEVLSLYNAAQNGDELTLPETQKYRTFIDWLQQQDGNAAEAYWRDQMKGAAEGGIVAIDQSRGQGSSDQNHSESVKNKEQNYFLNDDVGAKLYAFAKQQRLTISTILQGVWGLWMTRSADNQEAVFGTAIANRPPTLSGAERMIGLFINVVPVRIQLDRKQAIIPWLQELQTMQRQSEQYGYCGLIDIQRWAGIPTASPLFDSILVFENYPLSSVMALDKQGDDGLRVEGGEGYECTHYPLALMVIPEQSKAGASTLQLCVRYDALRFSDTSIARLFTQFETLLAAIIDECHICLGDLPLLNNHEWTGQQQIACGPKQSISQYTVPQQLAHQTSLHPKRTALIFDPCDDPLGVIHLRYEQLSAQVNQLARYLQQQGVSHGDRVGLCLARDEKLPVAMLAVLSLGAAYIPLDPEYPSERIEYITENARLSLLLVDAEWFLGEVRQSASSIIDLRSVSSEINSQSPEPIVPCVGGLDDVAYIIYTSGSTGRPKGVVIRHRSLNNFLGAMARTPGISDQDRLLAVTTVSFDISVLELFLPLVSGAQLVLAPPSLARDGECLGECLQRHDISLMQATPATWRLLLEGQWQGKSNLTMLCGGEALDIPLARWLLSRGAELWNMYGPTETTVWSMALKLESQHVVSGSVPVGGVIDNTKLLVLDKHLQPLPTGVAGELYIAGEGLAEGYYNQPSLTQEVFIENPSFNVSSKQCLNRIYRTGDRVRLDEHGLLCFLGRTDNQVKLRGFRIELGEIESLLLSHKHVSQALVMLCGDSSYDSQLVAYLVLNYSKTVEAEDARILQELPILLRKHLPHYMIPSQWQLLPAMPLTPNGKVDRQKLPKPNMQALDLSRVKEVEGTLPLEQALDELEELVANVWIDVLNLKVNSLKIHDDFFDLGGHSLLATRTIGRLQQLHSIHIPLRTLFEYPQLAHFCNQIQQAQNTATPDLPIRPVARQGLLPVSWAQRRQWLLQQLAPSNKAYHIPLALRLSGPLNVAALQASFQHIINSHESLRVAFVDIAGEPRAQVEPKITISLPLTDLSAQNANIDKEIQKYLNVTFDLSQAPLFRARLFCIQSKSAKANQEHVLLLIFHHIIVDDWSLALLVKQLSATYQALSQSQVAPPIQSTIGYADFAAWQRQQDHSVSLQYWQKTLKNLPDAMVFPQQQLHTEKSQAMSIPLELDSDLLDGLRRLGRKQGTTIFMTLLSGFYIVLSRYTGNRDLLVGCPIAGRSHPQTQDLVGMFVNTLLLRASLKMDQTVSELLAQTRQATLSAYEHQDLPFEQLLNSIPQLREQSGEPIPVLFTLQSTNLDGLSLGDLDWSPIQLSNQQAKFDLSLSLRENQNTNSTSNSDKSLLGSLEYRSDRFKPELMQQLIGHYLTILKLMVAQPQQRYSTWDICTQDQKNKLMVYGSGPEMATGSKLTADWNVHSAFQQQVERNAQKVAIIDGETCLSYNKLNIQANRLAHLLIALGVAPETPVGLWGERGWQALVSILAILKAGAYFVALDPNMPPARVRRIIKTSKLELVLTASAGFLPDLSNPEEAASDCVELPLDALLPELEAQPVQTPFIPVHADQLAYVMHTSGSTGEPKGVAAVHRGILRLVQQVDYVELDSHTVMLQSAPLAFDAATFEVWGALLNGGTLVIQRSRLTSLEATAALIRQHNINTAWFTAGLFHAMVDEQLSALVQLEQLLAGGDVLSMSHIRRLYSSAASSGTQVQLINGYGPTETTTFVCCHRVSKADLTFAHLPIGKPINGTQLYILDNALQLVPQGVTGELYIGGVGLARGYLHEPKLSAQSFIPNPFCSMETVGQGDTAMTLYQTGDQVLQREDGVIEFLGRVDQQIKIRGFRIETAEVEQVISSHPDIQSAFVDTVEVNNRRQLVAWYCSEKTISVAELCHLISKNLPEYMMPCTWHMVHQWPLTVNGKLDRQALPSVIHTSEVELSSNTEKLDELERTLLNIWQMLLPAVNLTVYSQFFEVGGDSIIAMQLTSRAVQIGLPLTPALVFQYPSIAELAQFLRQQPEIKSEQWQLAPQWPTGDIALSPIQHWYLQQNPKVPTHFNQSVMLRVNWPLAKEGLEALLKVLAQRHDALRLRFVQRSIEGHQWQAYFDSQAATIPLTWVDISHLNKQEQKQYIEEEANKLHKSLNLECGPLLCAACFNRGEEEGLSLLFVAHHLIVDGVSWRLLFADLHQVYRQQQQQRPLALPLKPFGVQAWAQCLQHFEVSSASLNHWQQLAQLSYTRLPLEEVNTNQEGNAQRLSFVVNVDTTQALLQLLPQHSQAAIGSAILAAVTQALCQWSNQKSLLVNLESHGRSMPSTAASHDYSQALGWFTCLYPTYIQCRNTLLETAIAIAQQQAAVPDHGLSYGVLTYLQGHSHLASQAEVSFNYLGQLDLIELQEEGVEREAAPGQAIHPQNARAHILDINCWVEQGALTLDWTFVSGTKNHQHIEAAARTTVGLLQKLALDLCDIGDEGMAVEALITEGATIDEQGLAAILEQVSFNGD